jgi:cation transport ATPase
MMDDWRSSLSVVFSSKSRSLRLRAQYLLLAASLRNLVEWIQLCTLLRVRVDDNVYVAVLMNGFLIVASVPKK